MSESPFQNFLAQQIKPKELVLSALFASKGDALTTAQLIRVGQLLGVEENSVRVTLHRLVKDGDAKSIRRGCYVIGDQRKPWYNASQEWSNLPNLTRCWDGDWLIVHTTHLTKSDRPAKNKRERTLTLHGFSEAVDSIWCRPNNLSIENECLCDQMFELGLEKSAIITVSKAIGVDFKKRFPTLWDTVSLERSYLHGIKYIGESRQTLRGASPSSRARETALLLNASLKFLASDPLLPAELLDVRLRNEFHTNLLDYYRIGREAWAEFHSEAGLEN